MTPLRRLLARHLLGMQLPLVAILLGLAWWGARALLLDQAQRDGEARLRIAVQALDQRLSVVERGGALVHSYWAQGRLPFRTPEADATLLMPWLYNQDGFHLLNLVDERGQAMLLMQEKGGWHGRVIREAAPGRFQLGWQTAGPLGLEPPDPRAYRDSGGYDPRARPWYQEARLLETPRWSMPYRLGPPENRLVMTWLVPLKRPGQLLEGALGLDLVAAELQGFLDLLRPTPGSRLWLLDQQAQVLSAASGGQGEAPVPTRGDLASLGGLRHRILRSDVPRHPGSQWHMILAIPESDLLASVQGRLLGVMGAAFTCLMLPILWGLWVGTRLSNRVQGLAEAADQLGAGDLPDLPAQDVSEFQRLGQALRQAHRDIQERNTLQQQLQHSQRLETLGTLAGGIAHDVNNHLSAILGHTFMVRESLPAEHPTQGRLAQVEEAANSCAKTTRTLLAFSRHGHSDLQPLDLNSLLEEMSLLFNSLLGGLVRVDLDLDPAPARIRGDRLQLEQVLMNLAVNARDAMPDGGILTFQTRHAGGTLLLRVEDNGTGMEPETLSRIFEPFFTTKPVGKGTGLGLAMVHGILQSHRGRVEVESRVGKGTTFTLSFPGDGSAPQLPVLAAQPLDTRGALANLHILVAEDESYLRETLEQALVMVGARVVSAASGSEAWEYFQDHAFDCVLSDQRMPGCTGMDLLRQIRASGRETPFILASGQDLEPFRAELSQDPALRLLPKPFSIAGLIELIEGFGIAPRAC